MSPLFSIVIPTRNHGKLLRQALESALSQDFADFEIIVSDNDSSDNTRQVVANLDSERIHYVNTGRFLRIADSWNFAIQHASGDYIQLIGDDDFLHPQMLKRVSDALTRLPSDIVVCNYATYYYPTHSKRPNQLLLHPFSNNILRGDSHLYLQSIFAFKENPPGVRTFVSRRLVDKVIEKAGWFYSEPFPEHVALPLAFSLTQSFTIIDYPLVIVGVTGTGTAAQQMALPRTQVFEDDLHPAFTLLPLKGFSRANFRAASYVKAKYAIPELFKDLDIDLEGYLISHYCDLALEAKRGRDVTNDYQEFDRFVRNLPERIQKRIYAKISPRHRQKYSIAWLFQVWRNVIAEITSKGSVSHRKWPISVNGCDAGFVDSISCVRNLDLVFESIVPARKSESIFATMIR